MPCVQLAVVENRGRPQSLIGSSRALRSHVRAHASAIPARAPVSILRPADPVLKYLSRHVQALTLPTELGPIAMGTRLE